MMDHNFVDQKRQARRRSFKLARCFAILDDVLISQPKTQTGHLNNGMSYEDIVLSVNPDTTTLVSLEAALRGVGFKVISVSSPIQARFEIEMGRCGVFLSSYVMSSVICRDLINLFRSSCPGGLVVFRMQDEDNIMPEADIMLSASDDPQAIALKIASRIAKASRSSAEARISP